MLVYPLEALRGERRAGGADSAKAPEVTVRRRLDLGLHAGRHVAGTGAEAGHPGLLGQVPEDSHVRVPRAAVIEDDRCRRQQRPHEEVPHHPTGGREPEDAVLILRVDVQVELLQVLQQDSAVALDDRLR